MWLTIVQRHRARILAAFVALSLVVFLLHLFASFPPPIRAPGFAYTPDPKPKPKPKPTTDSVDSTTTPSTSISSRLSLPAEYLSQSTDSSFCQARYGLQYLSRMRDSATSHCAADSHSSLTCFWSNTAEGEDRLDTMCVGTRAALDHTRGRFLLDCALHDTDGSPPVPAALTRYWYDTGPGNVVKEAVDIAALHDESQGQNQTEIESSEPPTQRTTVLVHREGSGNPWHSLMEIMSTSWTLDVLRMAPRGASGGDSETSKGSQHPFLADADADNTQIVLLDSYNDGPYIDLWRLFAKLPIRRLRDLPATEPPSNIVLPLAGGSNPLWQGDWTDLDCHEAPLLKTFIARTVSHLFPPGDSASAFPPRGPNVSVTFITRTTTRKLVHEDSHIAALDAAAASAASSASFSIPHMTINVVDFAAIPFREQIAIVRQTDVLVGVHGAGLTHLIFLQPGSAVVEILPEGFQHKGFRNLAQMLGHGYFRTHARKVGEHKARDEQHRGEEEEEEEDDGGGGGRRGAKMRRRLRARDWQNEDVDMSEDALLEVVAAAVKSLYSKGLRSFDVS